MQRPNNSVGTANGVTSKTIIKAFARLTSFGQFERSRVLLPEQE
jgi:hypothetical protein